MVSNTMVNKVLLYSTLYFPENRWSEEERLVKDSTWAYRITNL